MRQEGPPTQKITVALKSWEDELESCAVFVPGRPTRASICVVSAREAPCLTGPKPSWAKGGVSAASRVKVRALGANGRMSPQKTEAPRVPALLAGL